MLLIVLIYIYVSMYCCYISYIISKFISFDANVAWKPENVTFLLYLPTRLIISARFGQWLKWPERGGGLRI